MSKKSAPLVGIVMGSDSDLPVMNETARLLDELGVTYEMEIASAHRTPDRAAEYAHHAVERGLRVIVAGAGGAFHLAGAVAAHTTLPVVAVPLANSPLQGFDALLAAVQMPGGVPVGVMAVGKAGAVNAGIFAAQIIGVADKAVAKRLVQHKEKMAREVAEKNARLKSAPSEPRASAS
jgi:phosphoribosylaminoimidazole carboxylase PurE protein